MEDTGTVRAEIDDLTARTGARLINPDPGTAVAPQMQLMMLRIIAATRESTCALAAHQ